jgi:hypothetical protein
MTSTTAHPPAGLCTADLPTWQVWDEDADYIVSDHDSEADARTAYTRLTRGSYRVDLSGSLTVREAPGQPDPDVCVYAAETCGCADPLADTFTCPCGDVMCVEDAARHHQFYCGDYRAWVTS